MLQRAILISFFLALGGCKLVVILVEGGEVQSEYSGTCSISSTSPPTGNVCIHEIADTSYWESFTAVPDEGWYFVKWNEGGNFLCASSSSLTCIVTNAPLAGIPAAESEVASDATYYIMPIFAKAELPRTILANSRLWKQPVDFTNLSWYDVNAVCPLAQNGDCEGTLNGINVDDWKWASVEEVALMLNSYGAGVPLGGGEDEEANAPWAVDFFDAGWELTFEGSNDPFTAGWTRDEGYDSSYGTNGGIDGGFGSPIDYAYSGNEDLKTISESYMGVWLYYSP